MQKIILVSLLLVCLTFIYTEPVQPSPYTPARFPFFTDYPETTHSLQELVPQAYLPLTFSSAQFSPWVNIQNKETVRQFYLTEYLASEGVSSEWTGNHASCIPGTTSETFRQAIFRRINYFRAMAGVPPLSGFKDAYNHKAQAASLMMSVNRQLSHNPPGTWTCFSADGYEGASSSNLYLGVYGPPAISGYMYDSGSGNYAVGHRRWILYPQTRYMGTGDIPSQGGYPASNALWVFDTVYMWGARPQTREPYVTWPPPGYVPRQVVYPRWSFAYAHADFSGVSLTVTRNGLPVSVTVNPIANGYGENTLVWELGESLPQGEVVYSVQIENVIIDTQHRNFSYQVMVFDPFS
jgi:uncharacterized protein YkwD